MIGKIRHRHTFNTAIYSIALSSDTYAICLEVIICVYNYELMTTASESVVGNTCARFLIFFFFLYMFCDMVNSKTQQQINNDEKSIASSKAHTDSANGSYR